jgi:hypothetical protein
MIGGRALHAGADGRRAREEQVIERQCRKVRSDGDTAGDDG